MKESIDSRDERMQDDIDEVVSEGMQTMETVVPAERQHAQRSIALRDRKSMNA